jgi:hypothetical protein
VDEVLERGQLDALGLVGNGLWVRPSGGSCAPAEVDEFGLRNIDVEGADLGLGGRDDRHGVRFLRKVTQRWKGEKPDVRTRPRAERLFRSLGHVRVELTRERWTAPSRATSPKGSGS